MIRVKRINAPKWLTRCAERWTNELLAAIEKHKQGGKKPSKNLWNKYNKKYVKNALKSMFHDKCAYCESKVEVLHIEHYRPKDKEKYPQFTFNWQNLLLACPTCNSKKGNHFPLEDDDENKPLLLNPCQDDPAQHLQFEQARIVPISKRGHQTRKILDLNREWLWDERKKQLLFIYDIRRFVEIFNRNGDETKAQYWQAKLNDATSAESEYAAMVRQFMQIPLPEKPPL